MGEKKDHPRAKVRVTFFHSSNFAKIQLD